MSSWRQAQRGRRHKGTGLNTNLSKRRKAMSWSKIFAVTAVVMFVFGIATIDCAVAGEKVKMKAHGSAYNVKWEKIDVGDEAGHMIGIYENKGISFDEITGGRMVDRGMGMMDINPKTGLVTIRGY